MSKNFNNRDQQFRVTYWNNLLDTDLALLLRIDGEVVRRPYLPAGQHASTLGIHKNSTSLLPFKFRELELVGMFTALVFDACCPLICHPKTQTWKKHPSCLKWGPSKFRPFAPRSYAQHKTYALRTMDCTGVVYRSAARWQGGIMSGTRSPKSSIQFLPRVTSIDPIPSALRTRYPPMCPRMM
jgi:hypothetical protein